MTEWFDNKNKSSSNIRNLLKERIDRTNPRHELTTEEAKRLAKLEGIAVKLKRGQHVQNRQLQTWLSEDEYEQLEYEWKEQLEIRSELKDKPSDLKRYAEKLKQATFNYNCAEGYSSKGKHSTAKKLYYKSESLYEDGLEILQEILHYGSSKYFSLINESSVSEVYESYFMKGGVHYNRNGNELIRNALLDTDLRQ